MEYIGDKGSWCIERVTNMFITSVPTMIVIMMFQPSIKAHNLTNRWLM